MVPKAQNFVAPEVIVPSAKSPSESIEKFRRNTEHDDISPFGSMEVGVTRL